MYLGLLSILLVRELMSLTQIATLYLRGLNGYQNIFGMLREKNGISSLSPASSKYKHPSCLSLFLQPYGPESQPRADPVYLSSN